MICNMQLWWLIDPVSSLEYELRCTCIYHIHHTHPALILHLHKWLVIFGKSMIKRMQIGRLLKFPPLVQKTSRKNWLWDKLTNNFLIRNEQRGIYIHISIVSLLLLLFWSQIHSHQIRPGRAMCGIRIPNNICHYFKIVFSASALRKDQVSEKLLRETPHFLIRLILAFFGRQPFLWTINMRFFFNFSWAANFRCAAMSYLLDHSLGQSLDAI